jgi:hypothetical protein
MVEVRKVEVKVEVKVVVKVVIEDETGLRRMVVLQWFEDEKGV